MTHLLSGRLFAAIPLLLAAASVIAAEPGRTLSDDLKGPGPTLVAGYADQRPRLLFGPGDKPALVAKAADQPVRWKAVLNASRHLGNAAPAADDIKNGKGYWRVERVQSGALAAFVTGDAKHADAAKRWLTAFTAVDTWGTGYRPNLDLEASWYLYHLSIAYDLLHGQLSDAERQAVRDGLAGHARAIAADLDPVGKKDKYRFDQNHTYIPTVALATAALALRGEVPEAEQWLKLAHAIMNRCRYVLGPDGYYFEGFGYWTYALHWHVRYADMLTRATGKGYFDLPALRENWRFALHLSLPGKPGAFDIGDLGMWQGDDRTAVKVNNHGMLWAIAGALKQGESRTAGDFYDARAAEFDYPASAFLWFAGDVDPTPLEKITPYHHFADHDVVTWRSGWGDDATAVYFRCGPPEGHAAAAKLKQLADWTPNAGHVHPDIGAFYLYARGAYLATTTGYTAEKWTRDQNTLLVDGKGQGMDGTYWNDRGIPYDDLDAARITAVHLTPAYAYARGTMGRAYTRQVKGVDLNRAILATKTWLLIVDDLAGAQPHALTWLCHADAPFTADGPAYVAKLPAASLAVLPLTADLEAKAEPTTVAAGTKPGQPTPTQRGHHLALTMKTPAKSARLVNLLVPLGKDAKPPTIADAKLDGDAVSFTIQWPDGKSESVSLNLAWTKDGEPASIK